MGLEKEEADQQKRELERLMRLGAGVKLSERQFDKKLGGYHSAGYRKGKLEVFVCGNCSQEIRSRAYRTSQKS